MLRIILFIFVVSLVSCKQQSSPDQAPPTAQLAKSVRNGAKVLSGFHKELHDNHSRFREKSLDQRRFKHAELMPLLDALPAEFSQRELGKSIEGRSIKSIRWGKGSTKVLLWSQMHGDESTATMALLDVFRFLSSTDEFDPFREKLRNNLDLYFVPMLNPDGAEKFERRNAIGVDLNRDALRLQTPEAQILKQIRDETQAVWGFNLHDQNRYYAAGNAPNTTAFSFLAPAYNEEKSINEVRGNAMRMVSLLNEVVQAYLPGQVGRYDDTFEPRAFGDNIQKWGTSTILIESGALNGDLEKQYLRQLHFVMLLVAFDAIADGSYQQIDLAAYEQIPFNNSNAYHDLIIREATLMYKGKPYIMDLGFRQTELSYNKEKDFFFRGSLTDMGDLSTFFAYDELMARGYELVPGQVYPQTLADVNALAKLDVAGLLKKGYTDFLLDKTPSQAQSYSLPVMVSKKDKTPSNEIKLNQNPAFLLKKDGAFRYAVVNAALFDLEKDAEKINGMLK
ncbi:MAG TPA: M14 family zinc carboxypeptidase [Saprospiraceae bacterium]|nr:M14 family zinc carboxypeptidase [Saprospiraceae bacterium]